MAEKFRFFDAVQDEFGMYDREYNAQEFTDYFKALVTTGVMKGAGNQLAVSANGSNMITKVNTGIAFLLGRYYENDSFKDLTHDTETLGNSRIDRIVVRMDLSTEARYVKSFIKKGAPSTNPVAPTLTQTANLYEISLAQVRIVGGQTFIASNNVTDERGKDIICPWAGSKILPNFDNDALENHINKYSGHTPYVHASSPDGVTYNVELEGITEYVEGMAIAIKPNRSNAVSAAKISINGLPEKNIAHALIDLPLIGMLRSNSVYTLRYNGSYFIIQGAGFSLLDSFNTDSTLYAPTVRALKQVNDKFDEKLRSGTGAPEGVVTAPIGTIYTRTTGGTTTTLYIKTSGVGNTGWTAK